MQTVMLVSTAADLIAVAVLAWLLLRGTRAHAASLQAQREALVTLREDVGSLLADAERRSEELERALRAREKSLRSLIAEVGRLEGRQERQPEGGMPVMPLTRPSAADGRRRATPTADAAEERLLRELASSFPARSE